MKKDICAQFLCKDCEDFGRCQYYHSRKEDSYICKYFHLSDKLDKIRAEIEKEIVPRNSDQYDYQTTWQNLGLRIALKVIDKYKAESEGKEGSNELCIFRYSRLGAGRKNRKGNGCILV